MEVTVLDILNARDRRVEKQKELLQKYGKPLICFTMNIPGPVKVSPDIRAAFKIGDNFLHHLFKVVYEEDTSADTGYEKFYIVDQDPACIKRSCIAIESIISCGRLFDMDVLTTDGQKLSRETPRKCLICEKDAAICEQVLMENKDKLKFQEIHVSTDVAKISIVGAGMQSHSGVASTMFEALYESKINIKMISTSEIRLSVLLDENDVNRAVKAIHDKFFDEN